MGAVSGGWLIGTDAVIGAGTAQPVAAQFACAEDNFGAGRRTAAAGEIAVKADL